MMVNQCASVTDMNRYLSGMLDRIEAERVRAHCHQCEKCERERRSLIWLRTFQGQNVTSDCEVLDKCFSDETLEKYNATDSNLTADERSLIANHLRNCEGCRWRREMVCLADTDDAIVKIT